MDLWQKSLPRRSGRVASTRSAASRFFNVLLVAIHSSFAKLNFKGSVASLSNAHVCLSKGFDLFEVRDCNSRGQVTIFE